MHYCIIERIPTLPSPCAAIREAQNELLKALAGVIDRQPHLVIPPFS
jgi:hypothetical protein